MRKIFAPELLRRREKEEEKLRGRRTRIVLAYYILSYYTTLPSESRTSRIDLAGIFSSISFTRDGSPSHSLHSTRVHVSLLGLFVARVYSLTPEIAGGGEGIRGRLILSRNEKLKIPRGISHELCAGGEGWQAGG